MAGAILFLPSRHCCLLLLTKAGEALNVCGTPTSPQFEFTSLFPSSELSCSEKREWRQYREPGLCWLITESRPGSEAESEPGAQRCRTGHILGKLRGAEFLEPHPVGLEHREDMASEGERPLLLPCGR